MNNNALLRIANLQIAINDQEIVKGFNLTVEPGSVHALMGPNGSGKSTLAYALMGHPAYTVTGGRVMVNDQEILELSPDKRAKLGIFLAFQYPLEIPGLTVANFLREAYNASGKPALSVSEFYALIESTLQLLNLDKSFAHRALNDGFSGGEKKRLELLQLMLLQPKLAILDEIDSGLDVDALKLVAHALGLARKHNPSMSIILITHYQRILEHVIPDYVHVMINGALVATGTHTLAHTIESNGYDAYATR
jgi:Fe-S cluster assembly ATP-binding protein